MKKDGALTGLAIVMFLLLLWFAALAFATTIYDRPTPDWRASE